MRSVKLNSPGLYMYLVVWMICAAELAAWGQPAAPTGIKTWGMTKTWTTVIWKDNATDETNYRVERSVDGGSFSEIATVGADSAEYKDESVDPNKTYQYRVRAYRSSDDSYSAYSNTVRGPVVLESTNFRVFYNTNQCFPITGNGSNCTPATTNATGENEYAGRILDVLEAAYKEFVTKFSFQTPWKPISSEPMPVNFKYCDGGGCANGGGIGLGPAFLGPYNHTTNIGSPGSLIVPAHEFFHMIQNWGAVKTDPSRSWIFEGQARAIQDLVCLDFGGITCQNIDDDPSGIANYYGEVNAYLGDPNRPVTEISYTSALFWNYLCQRYGSTTTEPERGLDFLQKFWDEADDDVNRDAIQVINATLGNLGVTDRFRDAFKDFVITNYAKDLTGGSVPAKYRYMDEQQNPGHYNQVKKEISIYLGPTDQIGPALANVTKWGAVYHEILPATTVPYLQFDYSVDSGHPAFFCILAVKGGDIAKEIRYEGTSFAQSFANDEYEKVVVIVAGLENNVNFRYVINGTRPVINILHPLASRKADVGDKDAPDKFLVKLEVLDPDANPITGIDASAFSFKVGSRSVPVSNIVTNAYIQGQYWFVIQAPTQTAYLWHDLIASWSVLSDTEIAAVRYSPQSVIDNVLVIDRSGSMNSPTSKIQGAKEAAKLYVNSWRDGNKIGVVSFNCNETADLTLRDLDTTSRDAAFTAITNLSPGGGTSIGNGLKEGLSQLTGSGDSSHSWAIVLLSDGLNTCDDDIKKFYDDWYKPRNDAGNQVPVIHTVAIGANADRPDLEWLAEETGGIYQFAAEPSASPKGLLDDFDLNIAEVYRVAGEQVARHQQILAERGEVPPFETPDIYYFDVDAGASELVVAFRNDSLSEVYVLDPSSATHTPTFDESYSHKVFRIGSPLPGRWSVVIRCPYAGEFCGGPYLIEASIRSTLTMHVFFGIPVDDRIIGTPMPVLVSLTDTEPISTAAVSVLITDPNKAETFLDLYDDGAHGDGTAGDGIYGNTFYGTNIQGTYQVEATANGYSPALGSFSRRLKRAFHMRGDLDEDQDGMPDGYERRVGLDPKEYDSHLDPDQDDLSNYYECRYGTDPFNPDTDGGGEGDGSEVNRQKDPHDPEDDGVRPPRLVAVPGVGRNLLRYNLPFPVNPQIQEVTYTYEVWRCVGDATECSYFDGPVYPVTDTFQYVDTSVRIGEVYKYRLVMVGPSGERSAPSDIVTVTTTVDPYPPFGYVLINDGEPTTFVPDAKLTLFARDGYEPGFLFDERDAYDPNAETSGVDLMMVSNRSDFSDADWEPYVDTIEGWLLEPNQSGIATVYVKYRDFAGCESVIYHASIKVLDEPTPTPTATETETPVPTPTRTPTFSPTPTPTEPVCRIPDDWFDRNGNGRTDAGDLLELIEAVKEGRYDMTLDFNCDGRIDGEDFYQMMRKWREALNP